MAELLFEKVYETVCGLRTTDLAEGVEDIFVPGGFCDCKYAQMLGAYERLCQRLGTGEEDKDVEIIIDAFMDVEREIARQMFRYGMKFGAKFGCQLSEE